MGERHYMQAVITFPELSANKQIDKCKKVQLKRNEKKLGEGIVVYKEQRLALIVFTERKHFFIELWQIIL